MWGVRRRRRSIQPGFADGKRGAFRMAAIQLYAWRDYEGVTIRDLAREARVCAATFNDRFGGLEGFWYAMAGAQFQAATRAMKRELNSDALGDASPEKIVRKIVEHVVTGMDCQTIGITRMAVKLGTTAPRAAESFRDYRTAITDRAVKLLDDKLKLADPEGAVRPAMRAVLAIAADTSWHHYGPLMSQERETMIDELKGLMCRSLGLDSTKGRKSINRFEADDTEKTMIASVNAALRDQLPIYKVDLRALEKAAKASRKQEVKLTGRGINADDGFILYARDRKRELEKRLPKPKRTYKVL